MVEHAFVTRLKELHHRNDRGALAALRRGLGQPPGSVAQMHPYVARFLAEGPWNWRHQCHYILAALYASHPESIASGNFGDTFRKVEAAAGGDSIEKRFVALLASHRDDLFDHLRQAVSLASGKDIPICWEQLFFDIQHWDDDSGRVQREWSRSYWGGLPAGGASKESTNTIKIGE